MKEPLLSLLFWIALGGGLVFAGPERELRVGRGFHAFDHLGNIGEQAGAAASSGVNIIYATGLGGAGYGGLPGEAELAGQRRAVASYNQSARRDGIRVILGYLCATSIVKMETFDAHWSAEFRKQFNTPPAEWRQQGRDGKPLPSWYGGDYQPACMNHPDWLAYEKFMVRQQLITGHDGIFFDNPTVHPQGCYCPFCMKKFTAFLREAGIAVSEASTEFVRRLADQHPKDFLRFRGAIARDFLSEMRRHARTIKSGALITCNNSLNSPEVLFSQARTYGYNIFEKSKAEDFVVVEDMSHQPRRLADGRTVEYGPTYRQLAALSHGKPIVAVTIAEADYHTPPNLVRLAMAEAAAHEASYLAWPTWPAEQRPRMAAAIRPQADFLRAHEKLLNGTKLRADVLLLLPFQRWTETNRCVASELAAALTQRNVQYRVVIEDDLAPTLEAAAKSNGLSHPVLLGEAASGLTPAGRAGVEKFEQHGGKAIWADQANWLNALSAAITPSVVVAGPPTVRVILREQPHRRLVHLYNLDLERLSSFEDRVHPVTDLVLRVRVPFARVRSVTALTADRGGSAGKLPFTVKCVAGVTSVIVRVPNLEISTILVITP